MTVNFFQKAIARKIGNTFKLATNEGYDVVEFTHAWLCSEVAERIFQENAIDVAQWANYQLDSLMIELEEKGMTISKSKKSFPDEMYWVGYLLTYWEFMDHVPGKELNSCDVVWLINQYDTLHTTSVEYAISEIKEHMEYEKENCAELPG